MAELLEIFFYPNKKDNQFEHRSLVDNNVIRNILAQNSLMKVTKQSIKEKITEVLSDVVDLFDDNGINTEACVVDEIEVGLVIGLDGSVSIASVIEGSISSEKTIVVKLKRREHE